MPEVGEGRAGPAAGRRLTTSSARTYQGRRPRRDAGDEHAGDRGQPVADADVRGPGDRRVERPCAIPAASSIATNSVAPTCPSTATITVAARPSQRCAAPNATTSGTRIHSPRQRRDHERARPSTSSGAVAAGCPGWCWCPGPAPRWSPGSTRATTATTTTTAAYAQARSVSPTSGRTPGRSPDHGRPLTGPHPGARTAGARRAHRCVGVPRSTGEPTHPAARPAARRRRRSGWPAAGPPRWWPPRPGCSAPVTVVSALLPPIRGRLRLLTDVVPLTGSETATAVAATLGVLLLLPGRRAAPAQAAGLADRGGGDRRGRDRAPGQGPGRGGGGRLAGGARAAARHPAGVPGRGRPEQPLARRPPVRPAGRDRHRPRPAAAAGVRRPGWSGSRRWARSCGTCCSGWSA